MQLSGWKRLGIIASVRYAGGTFLFKMHEQNTLAASVATNGMKLCFAVPAETGPDGLARRCSDGWQRDYDVMSRYSVQVAAIYALAPIPFAWLLIWIIRSLYRWVRRGFQQQVS